MFSQLPLRRRIELVQQRLRPVKKPTAIVMGGSIGGLTAALWLEQAGFEVTVFERASKPLTSKGAGIGLHPECVRYFKEHSAFDISSISIKLNDLVYLRSPPQPPMKAAPIRLRVASYNSMIAGLKHHFPNERYHLGHEVLGISQTEECVTVTTSNGKRQKCDLLVCADGTESSARSLLIGSKMKEGQYSGYIAWRGIVAEELLSKEASDILGKSLVVHMTSDGHVIAYPIPIVSDDLQTQRVCVNWIWYRNVPGGERYEALMTDVEGRRRGRSVPPGQVQPQFVQEMKENLSDVSDIAAELFRATENPFIQAVFDQESSNISFGRVCLLGDAAFSVRPHVAVGTAKAAADARELALALGRNGNDVVKALDEYETKQGELGRFCTDRSRKLGQIMQSGDWEEGRLLEIGLFELWDSAMD